jgi:sulfoxide reductase heme-binding subunit YedZ
MIVAAATTGAPVAWLVARAAGLVAFGLLTASVTLGLALSTKLLGNRRGKALLGWHQTLMWTGMGMVVLHVGGLLLDPVLRFGFVAVLVPGAAPWRPLPVAAGIVTLWLMLVLACSFHVRRQIGQRRWRLLHYASSVAFTLGLYHALNVGSDLTGARGLIFTGVLAAPVLWLAYARILMPRAKPQRARVRQAPPAGQAPPEDAATPRAAVTA